MPMRAIGIKWLDRRSRRSQAAVKLDAPEKTLPRQPLNIRVQVAGAGANEDAYVTVAAVDVGILNLTRYEPPDPDDWYFGQRQLGLEIRDLYGRLIDGSLGATGRLRTGGDGGQVALAGQPADRKAGGLLLRPGQARRRRQGDRQLRHSAVQRHGPPDGGRLVEDRRRPCHARTSSSAIRSW